MNTCLGVCYDGPDELCCAGGYMFQKTFLLSNLSMTCCSNLEGQYECRPGEKCVTESHKAWCEAAEPVVIPGSHQCFLNQEQPHIPYYWDNDCEMDKLGCNADT